MFPKFGFQPICRRGFCIPKGSWEWHSQTSIESNVGMFGRRRAKLSLQHRHTQDTPGGEGIHWLWFLRCFGVPERIPINAWKLTTNISDGMWWILLELMVVMWTFGLIGPLATSLNVNESSGKYSCLEPFEPPRDPTVFLLKHNRCPESLLTNRHTCYHLLWLLAKCVPQSSVHMYHISMNFLLSKSMCRCGSRM